MRLWPSMAMVLVLAGAISASAQDAATKRNQQGPVTVTLTLLESSGAGIKARVVLDTHAGSLDGIAIAQAVNLRRPDGGDVAPAKVQQVTGGGHHRQAVVVFPPAGGALEVRIVVKNVGGVEERVFRWALPIAP